MWWLTDARDAHVVDPLRRTMLMNYFRSRTSVVGARVTFVNGCARERENHRASRRDVDDATRRLESNASETDRRSMTIAGRTRR